MLAFAQRTGLTIDAPPERYQAERYQADRYLWTDAFAVCNFLALGRTDLALRLVDQVHHTLGQHRPDDSRAGWLSGLTGAEAAAHPTAGGLRIGKRWPERAEGEPYHPQLEWERDGQYFHYLTKWMHVLDQVSRRTGDPTFNRWARVLADVAHRAFTRNGRGPMAWKMSVDLARPLVPSTGHHDPLDGFVTCLQLEATAARWTDAGAPRLDDAIAGFAAIIPADLATADPLGIGGLLTDAWRLTALGHAGHRADDRLHDRLLADAGAGLAAYRRSGEIEAPAERRLAFRELGLAIGLAAAERLEGLEGMAGHLPLRREIESFWRRPEHRAAESWREHQNINDVMLATALAPAGYLST